MKIGVISDTHDNLGAIQRAVSLFNKERVELVLHAGDFVAPFALLAFGGLTVPLRGVFGNCDGEKIVLLETANKLGFHLETTPTHFEIDNRKILLMHQPAEIDALVKSESYDLIIYGHLHKPEIARYGKTLVVSPGEGGGWVSRAKTVALIDLADLQAEIVEL